MTTLTITLEQARRSWVTQQHLGGEVASTRGLGEMVSEIGWIPMPSPVSPYLALFARGLIARRADLDARLGEFAVVPGPRGATWLVPVGDAPAARAFGVADHASREARVAATTTLPARDLEATREMFKLLLAQPATLEEILAKLPESARRSLGAAGRKAGLPTVASLVMRAMWVSGEIHRVARGGRLDSGPVVWSMDPRPRVVPPAAEAVASVATRWITAHGPVTARTFANAFGTPTGRAMPALRAARPLEVTIEGFDETFLARAAFAPPAEASRPGEPLVRLLPARDPLTDVHLAMLATPAGMRAATSRAGTPAPAVLVRGEVVGVWAYDQASGEIECTPVDRPFDADTVGPIAAEARRVAAFVR
ncbi:MAG: crosslink repair DNA glycosylase YcaQ family protein, partial [Deltaproteobacteria bacterium]